jgi:hypothetical protein
LFFNDERTHTRPKASRGGRSEPEGDVDPQSLVANEVEQRLAAVMELRVAQAFLRERQDTPERSRQLCAHEVGDDKQTSKQ